MTLSFQNFTVQRNGDVNYRGFPVGRLDRAQMLHVVDMFRQPGMADDDAEGALAGFVQSRFAPEIEKLEAAARDLRRG